MRLDVGIRPKQNVFICEYQILYVNTIFGLYPYIYIYIYMAIGRYIEVGYCM